MVIFNKPLFTSVRPRIRVMAGPHAAAGVNACSIEEIEGSETYNNIALRDVWEAIPIKSDCME